MADLLAIVPARTGSKGIPEKNFRLLAGTTPTQRVVKGLMSLQIPTVVTTDDEHFVCGRGTPGGTCQTLRRPLALSQDDTPMQAVVEHVLRSIPGPDDQIILLVAPTQPLREVKHLRAAIKMLEGSNLIGTVVSVTASEPYEKLLGMREGGTLFPVAGRLVERRQDATPTWRRDGTVYAWRRGAGYMPEPWWPLVIPATETAALDTPEDWEQAGWRLRQHAHE